MKPAFITEKKELSDKEKAIKKKQQYADENKAFAEGLTKEEKVELQQTDKMDEEDERFEEPEPIEEPNVPTEEIKKFNSPINKQEINLQLELLLRRLYDLERQLKTKRISVKDTNNLTGVMSEQQIISTCNTLKFEINNIINIMIEKYGYEQKYFQDIFKTISSGVKKYEYWLAFDKLKKPW